MALYRKKGIVRKSHGGVEIILLQMFVNIFNEKISFSLTSKIYFTKKKYFSFQTAKEVTSNKQTKYATPFISN